jgi:outer membrane protein assembly factor BamB
MNSKFKKGDYVINKTKTSLVSGMIVKIYKVESHGNSTFIYWLNINTGNRYWAYESDLETDIRRNILLI